VPTAQHDILEDLARRAASGDRDALEQMLHGIAPQAAAVAYTVTGNHDDALDATQAALIRMARDIRQWSGSSLRGWAHACAHAAAANLVREAAARRKREQASIRGLAEASMGGDPMVHNEALQALRQELAELPSETAAALSLHHLEEMPVAGVAAQLNISEDACKQRIKRGRDELRTRLEKRGIALAALTPAFFGKPYQDALAWSGRLDPQVFGRITTAAIVLALKPAAISVPQAPSESASSPHGVQHVDRSLKARPQPRRGAQVNRVVMTAALLVLIVAALVVGTQQLPAPERNAGAKITLETPRSASKAILKPAEEASVPAASRQWQAPRFINGNYRPLQFAFHGNEVALLVQDPQSRDARLMEYADIIAKRPDRLLVLRSSDGGKSWREDAAFPGAMRGNIGFSDDGRLAVVTLDKLPSESLKVRSGNAAWFTETKLGQFDAAGAFWSMPETRDDIEHLIGWKTELVAARGRLWFFSPAYETSNPDHRTDGGRETLVNGMYVYASAGQDRPELVSAPLACKYDSAAWAADASTAGFVVRDPASINLLNYRTTDGGKSWSSSEISLPPETSSGITPALVPVKIARDGRKLMLLTQARQRGPGRDDVIYEVRNFGWQYLFTSDDLGETWGIPSLVASKPQSAELHAADDIAIAGGRAFHAYLSYIAGAADFARQPHLSTSDDLQSWSDQDIFPIDTPVGQMTLGSDGRNLFIAYLVEDQATLVVHTFSAGKWPENPLTPPAWYKTSPSPTPTRSPEF
jgi:RNA polymerase sigma-70 factor (ECF subfamily)